MAYCDRCNRYFKNDAALAQHKDNSLNHFICNVCNRDFVSYAARRQHYMNSSDHHYCGMCDEDFDHDDELEDHYDEKHFYCRNCQEFFDSLDEEDDHKEEEHFYCREHRRMFNNENNLRHHMRTHLPKNLRCPGRNCGRAFALPADLLLHFESGACPSGVTRQAVDRTIIAWDRAGVITDPSRLLTGPGGSYAPRVVEEWATAESWNGSAYECVLCHRAFRQLARLNQHLQSPVHADKIYRCPAASGGCSSQFRTLSALVQHVEVASCGVRRFKGHIRDAIDDLSRGMRSLTF